MPLLRHPGDAPTRSLGYFGLPLLGLGLLERKQMLPSEGKRFLGMHFLGRKAHKKIVKHLNAHGASSE